MITDLSAFSGDTLKIRVTPKASSNRIKVEKQPDGSDLVRVYVTTVPEDGKANKAVVEMLAKALGVSKSSLTITQGLTSKDKTISIQRKA